MKQLLFTLITCLIVAMSAFGQSATATITLTGHVFDDKKEPLVGATVLLKNTTNGVVTDIKICTGPIINFAALSYKVRYIDSARV